MDCHDLVHVCHDSICVMIALCQQEGSITVVHCAYYGCLCVQGVPLNQGNLAASLANIIATYELTPEDKSLVVMPLFHVHGLMAGTPLSCLTNSAWARQHCHILSCNPLADQRPCHWQAQCRRQTNLWSCKPCLFHHNLMQHNAKTLLPHMMWSPSAIS